MASRRETSDRKSTRLNSSHGYISYAVFHHLDLHSFPTRRSSDLQIFPGHAFDNYAFLKVMQPLQLGALRILHRCGPSQLDVTARLQPSGGVITSAEHSGNGVTARDIRSEEHTSELQSRLHLVCRLPPPRSTLFPYTTLFRSADISRSRLRQLRLPEGNATAPARCVAHPAPLRPIAA